MKSLKSSIIFLFLFVRMSFSWAQIEPFDYHCSLEGINSEWHSIPLPDEIYSQTQNGLADLRIYGITANADTVEAPYLLQVSKDQTQNKFVNSEIINQSYKNDTYFFTVKIPNEEPINFLKLNFGADNFDCKILLEGSQNQQNWTTIIEDYRILSIKNELTNYQFSTLKFPRSEYIYYRITINSDINPKIQGVMSQLSISTEGNKRHYNNILLEKIETKDDKSSTYDIVLPTAIPIDFIEFSVANAHDYYRHIDIKYCTDSIQNDSITRYQYRQITNGVLSSFEPKTFDVKGVTTNRLQIKIRDNDNTPLDITSVNLSSSIHELLVRFDKPANYSMFWGNKRVRSPHYDLVNFKSTIPVDMSPLTLGELKLTTKVQKVEEQPEALFDHRYWLWTAIVISILVLGIFSFKMLRNS